MRDFLDYLTPDEWEMWKVGRPGKRMWLAQAPDGAELSGLLARMHQNFPERTDLLITALEQRGQWFVVYSSLGEGITAWATLGRNEYAARRQFSDQLEYHQEMAHL